MSQLELVDLDTPNLSSPPLSRLIQNVYISLQ